MAANLFGAPIAGAGVGMDNIAFLSWFPKPIESMDDFHQMPFRAPPGMVGATYADIGVPAVAMGGADILPTLEKGAIDAPE